MVDSAGGVGGYTSYTPHISYRDATHGDLKHAILAHFSGVVLDPDQERDMCPGTVVTYTHTLVNSGTATDTFDLTLSGEWGTLLTSSPVTVGRYMTRTVLVRVAIPYGARRGPVTTSITATSRNDPTVFDKVLDTTLVTYWE